MRSQTFCGISPIDTKKSRSDGNAWSDPGDEHHGAKNECQSVNLTVASSPRHNRSVITRRPASALLLLAFLMLPCLNICSGWDGSAKVRMACCATLGDHQSQAAIDACCALGEQRQNAESTHSLLSIAVPVQNLTDVTIASLFTAAIVRGSRLEIAEHDYATATSDRQILLSVFLI